MGRGGANSVRNDTWWLINSRCTSVMTWLTTSLTSSGTFSISVLFASARTRRITSLARLPSSIIHSTERRAAFRSGIPVEPAQTGLGVGDDAGERLFHFVGDRSRQFAQGCYAHDMGQIRLRVAQCLLEVLALCQIEHE